MTRRGAGILYNYSKSEATSKINRLAAQGAVFFFIINFEQTENYILTGEDLCKNAQEHELLFAIGNHTNFDELSNAQNDMPFQLHTFPASFQEYRQKFNLVHQNIGLGNSFLVNLTCKTPITLNASLSDIFYRTSARYKVYLRDRFVCFSPETFISINNGYIYAHPMKGTIDASIPNAEEIIRNDPKEMAEHVTIVDLIRNDLSMVAEEVVVKRFRYLEKVTSPQRNLWQVSSEIVGKLPADFPSKLGDLLYSLLPAGSISGAPKPKTMEIIAAAEGEPRGFFTGICGYFDGHTLDTGVMIRYIAEENGQKFFRSGGGITYNSDPKSEYMEMQQKIYVPIY